MNKQTLIILALAAALVAAMLLFENPFKGEAPRKRPEEEVQLFTPLNEEDCTRIEVRGMGTTGTLIRNGHEWYTSAGFKADEDALKMLFATLQQPSKPELVSINPNDLITFHTDSLTGVSLKMFNRQGQAQVNLIVGEMQGNLFQTPVRKPNSDNVYLIQGMLRPVVQRREWRDFTLTRLDPGTVKRILVQRPDETYAIERDAPGAAWHFSRPTSAPANVANVESWVQQLARLQATDFEPTSAGDTLTSYGLTPPKARLSLVLDDGSSIALLVGNADAPRQQYYAEREGARQVCRISEYLYNEAFKKSDTLKPPPPIPATLPGALGTTTPLPPLGPGKRPLGFPPGPTSVPPGAPPRKAPAPKLPRLTPPAKAPEAKTAPAPPAQVAAPPGTSATPSPEKMKAPKATQKPVAKTPAKAEKPTTGTAAK